MKHLLALAVVVAPLLTACSNPPAAGEHAREAKGESAEHGEESGTELSLSDTYDSVRNGVRLVLSYQQASGSFVGSVTNTTDRALQRVRVEVHLSNGRELGPTTAGDLKPGETRRISLVAESSGFDSWTAHPEVGSEEHGEEGGKEH
jgi:hypothetical protein